MKTKQIKYIWEVSRGQRGRILLSCLTGIIGIAVSLVFIYASKVVIDIATGAAIGSLTNAAIRKEKEYPCNGRIWQRYSFWWLKLTPVRRWLLAIFRRTRRVTTQ